MLIIAKSSGPRLGIVGHAADKFTPVTEWLARYSIVQLIDELKPSCIVSGHCHLGGIDIFAEEIANTLGIELIIHKPSKLTWSGGYKERNLKIAADSNIVAVVVVKDYPSNYKGMTFNGCYHCRDRNPSHVKSGGCWTAWKCKERRWIFV